MFLSLKVSELRRLKLRSLLVQARKTSHLFKTNQLASLGRLALRFSSKKSRSRV